LLFFSNGRKAAPAVKNFGTKTAVSFAKKGNLLFDSFEAKKMPIVRPVFKKPAFADQKKPLTSIVLK
jgi:hypothetical protein